MDDEHHRVRTAYLGHPVRPVEVLVSYLVQAQKDSQGRTRANRGYVREMLKANDVGYSLKSSVINVLLPDLNNESSIESV